MKALLTTIAAVLHLLVSGQGLTNAEVFNYALGDVVQSKYYYYGFQVGAWPQRYVRDSITGIAYDVNGLEVEYTSEQHRFCLPGGPFPAEDTVETVHFGYAVGNAYPEHAYLGLYCDYYVPGIDEVEPWALFCDRDTWLQMDFLPCDTCDCWEGNSSWYSRFVAGVGGPYYWRLPDEGPSDYAIQHELVYFRKGADACGTEIVMGLSDPQRPDHLVLSPNPAVDLVRWSVSPEAGDVVLLDASGRVLRQSKDVGVLAVEDLSAGLYLVMIRSGGGTVRSARFVKR